MRFLLLLLQMEMLFFIEAIDSCRLGRLAAVACSCELASPASVRRRQTHL